MMVLCVFLQCSISDPKLLWSGFKEPEDYISCVCLLESKNPETLLTERSRQGLCPERSARQTENQTLLLCPIAVTSVVYWLHCFRAYSTCRRTNTVVSSWFILSFLCESCCIRQSGFILKQHSSFYSGDYRISRWHHYKFHTELFLMEKDVEFVYSYWHNFSLFLIDWQASRICLIRN